MDYYDQIISTDLIKDPLKLPRSVHKALTIKSLALKVLSTKEKALSTRILL